jgi:hypothetical protein
MLLGSMESILKSRRAIVLTFVIYSCIHWTFDYIFGNTPVNILKLGGSIARYNYFVNVLGYVVVTLAFLALIILFAKDKTHWIIGGLIGLFAAAAMNSIIMLISYCIMIRSLQRPMGEAIL